MTRVGIVILLYNRADVATLCLRSLARAQTDIAWDVFLIDNGSRAEESRATQKVFDELVAAGQLTGVFIKSAVNLGFPGGNNVGFRHFLEQGDCTHICVLNSDVVVTDRWLERLLAHDADIIGPVTNACGNEQTIPQVRDSKPAIDDSAIAHANAIDAARQELFAGFTTQTDFLGFYCCIMRIEVLTDVGFLDERFGRGAYEDDDFCLRVLAAGHRMTVARDVFLWHWGTASFTQIPLTRLLRSLHKNKRLFERKHGIRWQDRSRLPVRGVLDDLRWLAQRERRGDGAGELARLYADEAWQYLEATAQSRSQRLQGMVRGRLARLFEMRPLRWLQRLGGFLRAALRRPVLVLGRFHPADAPEHDGYFQRTRLIDSEIVHQPRFYVRFENSNPGFLLPRIVRHTQNSYELHCGPRNVLHAGLLMLLAFVSGRVYVHSVLRLHDGAPRWMFKMARRRVLDVHGVVPDEFAFHGDPAGGKVHDGYERFALQHATALVVVSRTMSEHLHDKHGRLPELVLHMPMLPKRGAPVIEDDPAAPRRGVLYCGGLHKWQQLDKMLAFVHAHRDATEFTFLVTEPDAVLERYRERHGDEFPGSVRSVPANEVDAIERQHEFGLVLRQDNIVNRVACPTKLVEYISNGLVPIVESTHVGDFGRHGLRAVELGQPLPDAATRAAMASTNLTVLRRLQADYVLGAEALRDHLI